MNTQELLAGLAELAFDPHHVVPSPCVSVCRIDDRNDQCLGCHRTLDEIIDWALLDDAGKRAVWRQVCERARLPRALSAASPTPPTPASGPQRP